MTGVEEEVEVAGSGSGNNGRSAVEKEKTKMRERQRRSITTKIFHGLRKHGGYRLSPRADINEVLRELAREAGWVVDPDGTTYRAPTTGATGSSPCPLCGAGKGSRTPTPSSSVVITGGGGDCSTAASPHGAAGAGDTVVGFGGPTSLYKFGTTSSSGYGGEDVDNPLARYMYQRLGGDVKQPSSTAAFGGGPPAMVMVSYDQQQLLTYLQEARASSHNTPAGSHHHHG